MSMQREAATRSLHPLRIYMVLESDFTQRGGGGAESQLRTLARYLRRIGHGVTIITPLLPYGPQVTAERCYGLPVGRVPYPRIKLIGGILMTLKVAALLWQRRRRYDALHVHIGHHLGAMTCFLGPILGKPVVLKISGWWELEKGLLAPGRGPLDALARRWLKRATVVQALSSRIAGELEKQGFPRDKILVLPNAVDTARFSVRSSLRTPGTPFTAVFVGRLVAEKGLPTLFEAWAQAFAGRDDVRLRLVGGGPLEEELRQAAARLGIASQIEFLGHRDRVEEVLREADLGVLISRIEGLSNTLLEFMASGLPVLATRVSGSEDFVVTGRNGWLVDVGDVAATASALREAAGLPASRLTEIGQQARADVVEAAALDAVVGKLLQLYRGAHPRELGATVPSGGA
jgi:glycosyltransferase involved in cell wall biosynthesis